MRVFLHKLCLLIVLSHGVFKGFVRLIALKCTFFNEFFSPTQTIEFIDKFNLIIIFVYSIEKTFFVKIIGKEKNSCKTPKSLQTNRKTY